MAAALPVSGSVAPPAENSQAQAVSQVEAAAVTLSKGTWGSLASGIGTIVVAAAAWANSMKSDLQIAISKLEGLEKRMERLEDRQFNDHRAQADR